MNPFSGRKFLIGFLIIGSAIVLIVRLFILQVLDPSYKFSATNNSQRRVTQYPARGLIYDRNNELLVYNEAAYDLMINPPQLTEFDTTEFCGLLNIRKEQVVNKITEALRYSRFKPSIFLKQVSSETYAILQEKLYKFPGFFVQPRTLRKYPRPIAAHVLGYVGEVDESTIEKDEYYQMGDYIGISGIEKSYEKVLRGKKGVKIYLVDVHNRVKGSFQDGKLDKTAEFGSDIISTLDADLQEYGEKLMQNLRGSIVALEPSSGEILSLVSSPYYDPSLLVGRIRTMNYRKMEIDTLKPLFNRALMAKYPPGSTFKVVQALIGLEENVVSPSSSFYCDMGYRAGRVRVGCHYHFSPLKLPGAIQNSCNAYFCNVFRRIIEDKKFDSQREAFKNWRKHVISFGFGQKLNTDFLNELEGYVPTTSYYDRYYGKNGWKSLTIISLAIGQGELGITPLQMANMSAIIANKGYYHTPHIVKKIKDNRFSIDPGFKEKHYTTIDTSVFKTAIKGMELAVNGGTGSTARIAKLPDIVVCGKTGTAENPHGEDHSIFIAFAPKDNPSIAISVYVENAGYGSTWAAPIASLMIEKYLTDTISRGWLEDRIVKADLTK
jgi:penicillin-binding protein 2